MRTYVWGLIATACIGASVFAVHEVGHLVAVESLVGDSSINFAMKYNSGIPFVTGWVKMPEGYYTQMDLFIIGLAGPLWGFALSSVIFWTTKDGITAMVSSFFMVYQGIYCMTEPLKSLGEMDAFLSILIPITISTIWMMWYVSELKRSMMD